LRRRDILRAEMFNAFRLKVFRQEPDQPEAARLARLFDDRLNRGQYFVMEVKRPWLMSAFVSSPGIRPEPAAERWTCCMSLVRCSSNRPRRRADGVSCVAAVAAASVEKSGGGSASLSGRELLVDHERGRVLFHEVERQDVPSAALRPAEDRGGPVVAGGGGE